METPAEPAENAEGDKAGLKQIYEDRSIRGVPTEFALNALLSRKLLPFPAVSRGFYADQGRIWCSNKTRLLERSNRPVVKAGSESIGVHRGKMDGSLADNMKQLAHLISTKKRHGE